LYSIKPTSGAGDLDVVRATGATRVNASGLIETVANNVPRIDYTGGGCPSILVEPQRTNLLTYSEEFDDADWEKTNATVTANDAVAPDGETTADKIVEDSSTGAHYIEQSISHTSGVVYSVSFFAKADERTAICLQAGTGFNANLGNTGQFVSLITGEPLNSLSGVTVATQLIAGFWRISITFTAASTATSNIFILLAIGTSVNYAGDGTSGIFIWGAQLEEGAYATSYIPTVASTVTRNADLISKTGISDLIGQTEGTLYAEVDLRNAITGTRGILEIRTSGTQTIALICFSDGNLGAYIINSTDQFVRSITTVAGTYKLALAYSASSTALYINGVLVGSESTSVNVPPSNDIQLGYRGVLQQLNDRIKAAAILPTRLSNAELAALTTL
jgi:hypothetical protein